MSYSAGFYDQLINGSNIVAIYVRDVKLGSIIAMITTRITEEPVPITAEDQSSDDKRMAYIMTLGVLEEYRNMGIATLLLNFIKTIMFQVYNCDLIALDVMQSNRRAVEMYLRAGYKHIFTRPDYYLIRGKHFDSCHMKLTSQTLDDTKRQ